MTGKIDRRSFLKRSALGVVAAGAIAGEVQASRPAETSKQDGPTIVEPSRRVPVIAEADICVLGGSCTGVFAAVRAARLGAKVVLVEQQNCFGGTATISMVNVWHSLMDTEFKRPIIAGLTREVTGRLKRRKAVTVVKNSPSFGFIFNSEELKIELDELVREHKVKPYLHTFFVAPHVRDGKLTGVVVENKSGRGAILAKMFIDATGDGELCHRLGLPTYTDKLLQPPTTCARFSKWGEKANHHVQRLLLKHGKEFDIPEGFVWGDAVPGSDVYMLAGTRVFGVDCSNADDFTRAEMEGRRQVRAIMDMIHKYVPDSGISLQALPSRIGVRETRHIKCQYQLKDKDVLYGTRFDDAIANGSYRVDVHHQDKPGITLKYLDGKQSYDVPGHPTAWSRWREKTKTNPTFYQVPLRSIIPGGHPNLIAAGRMLDAQREAFGGVRPMVNMNQLGEAAGAAAYLALSKNTPIPKVDARRVRKLLAKGGSIII